MIKLLHAANLNGKTFPPGAKISNLDAKTEERLVAAGNAEYAMPATPKDESVSEPQGDAPDATPEVDENAEQIQPKFGRRGRPRNAE